MLDFCVGNLEEDIRSRRVYLCNLYGSVTNVWDIKQTDLLIAKLEAYRSEADALKYIKSYLINREQRVRVNKNFNEWERIIAGVPQGSIIVHLLFNIFLNKLFLFGSNSSFRNYADHNKLYISGDNSKNCIVLIAGKCHFMCLGNNTKKWDFFIQC